MQYERSRTVFLLALLAGLFLLAGCENTIEPFEKNAGLFSIHGLLTLHCEEHFIRVKDLNEPLIGDSTRVIDATVTLKNLATGQTETLADSVVTFQGLYTHNFRSEQDIQPATRYRVRVERPDGRAAQVTAMMPPRTAIDVAPDGPVNCTEGIRLHFQNIQDLRLLHVSVGFVWRNHLNWVDLSDPTVGSEGTPVYSFAPAGILASVFPDRLRQSLGFDREKYCNQLNDDHFRVAYTRLGPDWPADSVLANPLESSVKNGLGVFGGLERDTLRKPVR